MVDRTRRPRLGGLTRLETPESSCRGATAFADGMEPPPMCRWMAYSGNPLPLDFLLLEPQHNLIDQSLSATMAPSPTNGDGFGLGFYGRNHEPGTYHSIQPAWNDANLRELAHHIESPLVLAHVRRSTGTPVQQSNCHPFRYAEWLFVHNGLIRSFDRIRRDMAFEIDPSLFHLVKGSTDSELMFFLAVTYGLRDDPVVAMRRVVELIERCAKREGIENALQMTVGLSDGETLWSFRYSTERDSRTLFYSEDMSTLKALYPDDNRAHAFDEKAVAVASEPMSDRQGVWLEVPESSVITVRDGQVSMRGFEPESP